MSKHSADVWDPTRSRNKIGLNLRGSDAFQRLGRDSGRMAGKPEVGSLDEESAIRTRGRSAPTPGSRETGLTCSRPSPVDSGTHRKTRLFTRTRLSLLSTYVEAVIRHAKPVSLGNIRRTAMSHKGSFLKRRSSGQISRFSPIDDEVQPWNSDEYEAGYQARQEGATASFTATRAGPLAGTMPTWTSFMLEIASSELGNRGTAGLPNLAASPGGPSTPLMRLCTSLRCNSTTSGRHNNLCWVWPC